MEKKFDNFGEFITAQRLKPDVDISLRKLAENMDVSAPFWCDIEKNRKMPSMDLAKLNKLADILKLNSAEKNEMFDLAGKSRKELPADVNHYVLTNSNIVTALRTAKELNYSNADWKRMIEEMKNLKSER